MGFDPKCSDNFFLHCSKVPRADEGGGKCGTKRRKFATNFSIFSRRKTRIIIYYANRFNVTVTWDFAVGFHSAGKQNKARLQRVESGS